MLWTKKPSIGRLITLLNVYKINGFLSGACSCKNENENLVKNLQGRLSLWKQHFFTLRRTQDSQKWYYNDTKPTRLHNCLPKVTYLQNKGIRDSTIYDNYCPFLSHLRFLWTYNNVNETPTDGTVLTRWVLKQGFADISVEDNQLKRGIVLKKNSKKKTRIGKGKIMNFVIPLKNYDYLIKLYYRPDKRI